MQNQHKVDLPSVFLKLLEGRWLVFGAIVTPGAAKWRPKAPKWEPSSQKMHGEIDAEIDAPQI